MTATLTAVCAGLLALVGSPDAGLATPRAGFADEAIPIMTSSEGGLWLRCSIDARADVPDRLAGFCAHLAAEITRLTGREVQVGANAPMGTVVVGVRVAPIGSSRATVVLSTARQGPNGAEVIETQDLRLGRADAPLGASSAAALVHPLMMMLENAR